MEWYVAYLLLGAFVGFFAGLFGIGGGLVLVPVLGFLFEAQYLTTQSNLHLLALGTSMAAIILSAVFSTYTHHKHAAVNLNIVRILMPSMLLGAVLGTLFASYVSTFYLTIFFALFVYFAALQMLLNIKPKATRQLPSYLGMTIVGSGIGAISSLVSIGGGTLSVPFMLRHNISLKHAIGTSAALGIPIAIGGTVGYIVTGLTLDDLPPNTLGFVYLPALILLAIGSLFTTPLGARATHRLPIKLLRQGFSLLLLGLATKMLLRAFS